MLITFIVNIYIMKKVDKVVGGLSLVNQLERSRSVELCHCKPLPLQSSTLVWPVPAVVDLSVHWIQLVAPALGW